MRLPWTASISNQSILKEINSEYSLQRLAEAVIPILWPPMQRADSLKKMLMMAKIKSNRRRGQHRMIWLANISDSVGVNLSKLQEIVKGREDQHCSPWGHKELDMT